MLSVVIVPIRPTGPDVYPEPGLPCTAPMMYAPRCTCAIGERRAESPTRRTGKESMSSSPIPVPGDALLRAFLAGDVAACRRIEKWAAEVVRYQYFNFTDSEIADIVQDTLVSVWGYCSRENFRVDGTLRPLVRRIASARCIDCLRRRRPTIEPDEQMPYTGSLALRRLSATPNSNGRCAWRCCRCVRSAAPSSAGA